MMPAVWAQWLGAAVLAFALAWTSIDILPLALRCVVIFVALTETAVLAWVLRLVGITWPPFTALTGGFLGAAFGFIYTNTVPGRRKRLIQQRFAGRISVATYRRLLDSDEALDCAGERRECSLVVCEIFNRELLRETLSPADYVALSSAFLQAGAGALMEAGGIMTPGGGDSLRAIFGAPLTDPDHAAKACQAAHALGRRLETSCQEAIERWKAAPDYRIGINSGEMIAAAYAPDSGAGFNVEGEPAEFCRRLCLANTFYGSRMLLGPRAFELANAAVEVRPIELIRRRSQDAPDEIQEIYEFLAPKDALTTQEIERRDLFWRGVILFRKGSWSEAAASFQATLREGDDAPARFYLERIAHARAGEQALDWDSARL